MPSCRWTRPLTPARPSATCVRTSTGVPCPCDQLNRAMHARVRWLLSFWPDVGRLAQLRTGCSHRQLVIILSACWPKQQWPGLSMQAASLCRVAPKQIIVSRQGETQVQRGYRGASSWCRLHGQACRSECCRLCTALRPALPDTLLLLDHLSGKLLLLLLWLASTILQPA